jgi:hypothetical protein
MCGRYTLTYPDRLALRFDLPEGTQALEPLGARKSWDDRGWLSTHALWFAKMGA